MHTDIRALRHVVTLATTLNYTRASEELHLSQSALSRSIQSTEKRCGLRIFDRGRGGVHVTPLGKLFVERARGLVREAEEFERQVQRLAGGEDYEVAFGLAPLPAKSLLPNLAKEALGAQRGRRWRIEVNRAPELMRLLQEEKIEFFLCAEEQFSRDTPVKAQPLGQFPLSFVVRRGHPLLSAQTAGRYPVVSVAPIQSYDAFPAALVSRLEYPPGLVVNDYALVAAITRDSDAVWPTSSFAVPDELASGDLAVLPLTDPARAIQFSVVMYSLHKRTLSPVAVDLQAGFRRKIQQLQRSLPAAQQQPRARKARPGAAARGGRK